MLGSHIRNFVRDESGAYTIWSLLWFTLYVALGGLAVDVTDAYRTQTLLQSTADSAALAGAMSLPDKTAATNAAVGYAEYNMAVATNGHVVLPWDVYTGHWDAATRTFIKDGTPLDAVYTLARRADQNQNPLATNFLRIIGLQKWDVNTEAVAISDVPGCLTNNGFVARNMLTLNSNNYSEDTCFHAQNAVPDKAKQNHSVVIQNNNTFGPGSEVSMPDLADMATRQSMCDLNTGLCDPGTLIQGDMWPNDANPNNINNIIAGLRTGVTTYLPNSALLAPGNVPVNVLTGDSSRTQGTVKDSTTGGTANVKYDAQLTESFNGPYLPGFVYDIHCSNKSKTLNITQALLQDVAIIATCNISGPSAGSIVRSVIASDATGNGTDPYAANTINLANGWEIGTNADFCGKTGGGMVGIYATASVHVAAGHNTYGLRILAGGDIQFTANGNVYGISAEAWNNISAGTSNGKFTYCKGHFNQDAFAHVYRLVQ